MKKLKQFSSTTMQFLKTFYKIFVNSKIFDMLFYSALFYFLIKYGSTIIILAITIGFFASLLNDINSNLEKMSKLFDIDLSQDDIMNEEFIDEKQEKQL